MSESTRPIKKFKYFGKSSSDSFEMKTQPTNIQLQVGFIRVIITLI